MRYFLTLSYLGSAYNGWQKQPNAPSVQETLEIALGTLLREPQELTGCGRTDAGVHARYYVAHFDTAQPLPSRFTEALNSLLPPDIAIAACTAVEAGAHARYDAFQRAYQYTITLVKDPFLTQTAWFYPQGKKLDFQAMQSVATLLQDFEAFAPFCKSDSGLDNFRCQALQAHWEQSGHQLVLHISANRFLRGMVRLVVGACVYAGLGKMSPEAIRKALEQQTPLPRPHSVPPQGLALTGVKYPYSF